MSTHETTTAPAVPALRREPAGDLVTASDLDFLDEVIALIEATDPGTWWAGPTYRSPCGTQHCVLAQIELALGPEAMDRFEGTWANSYMIGGANDGKDPRYTQDHAKDRSLAYLRDLRSGGLPSICESMYADWMFLEAAPGTYATPGAALDELREQARSATQDHSTDLRGRT